MITAHTTLLPLATGALTLVVGASGYWHTLQERRREDRVRLDQMADRAVRIIDSTYVRPILRRRMEDTLIATAAEAKYHASSAYRMPLLPRHRRYRRIDDDACRPFCRLEGCVALSSEEKARALALAMETLCEDLRTDPDPPVVVHRHNKDQDTGDDVRRRCVLVAAIERAYHIRPRPAAQLIDRLGDFAGPTTVRARR